MCSVSGAPRDPFTLDRAGEQWVADTLKKLTLDDKVLDHVKLEPHLAEGKEVDPRTAKITLRHLLHHAGGWDRDKSYDPIGITPKTPTVFCAVSAVTAVAA